MIDYSRQYTYTNISWFLKRLYVLELITYNTYILAEKELWHQVCTYLEW